MEAHQPDEETNGSCEKGSSTLKLKLKMPKLTKEEEEETNKVNVVDGRGDEDENNVVRKENNNFFFAKQKKDHICCECGKEFSSGKALGGHMSSAHVQANQRLEESWKKKKKKMMMLSEESSKMMKRFEQEEEEEEIGGGDGVFVNHHEVMEKQIICDLCGKIFPSKKSLFGHMRCHPDRDWRGMKPPSTSKKNTKNGGFRANFHDDYEDEDEDDDGVDNRFDVIRDKQEENERSIDVNVVTPPPLRDDLKDCLKGWGAKDRRGRSPLTKKRSVSSTNSDEKELYDAVHQLIRLVHGNNNNNNNNNSEVMCSSNSVGSSAPKEAPFSDLKDKSKRKAVAVDDTIEEENCGETCSDSQVHKKRRCENEIVKLEQVKDLAVIKKTPEVKYKCNLCDKSFASHQALGGHRSSHNKFKITIENTVDHHDKDVQFVGDQEIDHGSNNNNNNVHKCKICDKIFSTGQALGGHQRSHWTNNQEDSSSQIASKVLDFDLNELPDLDDCYRY